MSNDNYVTSRILVVIFIFYISFSTAIGLSLFSLTDSLFFINVFPIMKDILLYSYLLIGLIFYNKIDANKQNKFMLIWLAAVAIVLLISLLISPANFYFKAVNFRRIFNNAIVFFVFFLFPFNRQTLLLIQRDIAFISLIIFGFGFFEYVAPDYLWTDVFNVLDFWSSNSTQDYEVKTLYETGRAYSSDLIFLLDYKVRRMISVFVEPTTFGLFCTVIYAYFIILRKWRWIALIAGLCGLLAMSKLFLISFIIINYFVIRGKCDFKLVMLSLVSSFFIIGYVYQNFGHIHGSLSHLFGFYTGIEFSLLSPLGDGIGVSGNRGQFVKTSVVNGEHGGESGVGNILAQLGFSGWVVISGLFFLLKYFSDLYIKNRDRLYFATYVVLIIYLVNLIYSASSLAFSANTFCIVLAAIAFKLSLQKPNSQISNIQYTSSTAAKVYI